MTGPTVDTQRSGYRTLKEFLLGDLEALRLVLRGGSVIDWHRLNFGSEQEAREFILAQEFDPSNARDAARMEAIAKLDGNPFDEYQVPLAILALLQGLGRLIRHRQDHGVLSILDPRILTRSYGRRFLASLPPTPIVRQISQVEQFLSRRAM